MGKKRSIPFGTIAWGQDTADFPQEEGHVCWHEGGGLGTVLNRREGHAGFSRLPYEADSFDLLALPRSFRGRAWRKVFRILSWPLKKLYNVHPGGKWQKTPGKTDFCWIAATVAVWRLDGLPDEVQALVVRRGISVVRVPGGDGPDAAVIVRDWPAGKGEAARAARMIAARAVVEDLAGKGSAGRFSIEIEGEA